MFNQALLSLFSLCFLISINSITNHSVVEAQNRGGPYIYNFPNGIPGYGSTDDISLFVDSCGIRDGRDFTAISVVNNCDYTVWAAYTSDNGFENITGGQRLQKGGFWNLILPIGQSTGSIWGRTNCSFDISGHGHCSTGDCGGLLYCKGIGALPHTLAEFDFNGEGDFLQISLLNGFNIPITWNPKDPIGCRGEASCTFDANPECPKDLKAPDGCYHPCSLWKTQEYCKPNNYTQYFQELCPQAHVDPDIHFKQSLNCPFDKWYEVVMCPKTH